MMQNQKQIELKQSLMRYATAVYDTKHTKILNKDTLNVMKDSNNMFAYCAKHFDTKYLIKFILENDRPLVNKLKFYVNRKQPEHSEYLNKLLLLI